MRREHSSRFDIKMRLFRIVGYGTLILFALFAAGAIRAHQYWPALASAAFAAAGLYIVLGAGSFTIDDQSVSHRSTFGKWRILWSEVSGAECSASGTIVLFGVDKRFVLSPPSAWTTPNKKQAIIFVLDQLKARGIAIRLSRAADYKTMKNTRIRDS